MKARSTMLVMVVFAIAGISPAAAQTVYVERFETSQLWHLASLTSPQNRESHRHPPCAANVARPPMG